MAFPEKYLILECWLLQIREADDLSQMDFSLEFLVMKFAVEVLGLGLREFRLACQGFNSYHILGIIPCLSLQEGGCGEKIGRASCRERV